MIQIHVKMQEALQQLQQLYTNFKNELEALPIGSLYTKKRKNQTYYYHTFRNSQKKLMFTLIPAPSLARPCFKSFSASAFCAIVCLY